MVEIARIDPTGSEYDNLMQFRGPLMEEWLAAWNALSPKERDFCTHPIWICAFLRSAQKSASSTWAAVPVHLYAIRDRGALVTCVPLMRAPATPYLPGQYIKSPKLVVGSSIAMPVAKASEITERLLDPSLWNGHRPLALIFDRVDSNHEALLNTPLRRSVRPDIKRAIMRLDDGFEHIMARLSHRTRRRMKKAFRDLEEQGNLTFTAHTDRAALMGALERYRQLEQCGWKRDSKYALANNQFNRLFYRTLIDAMAAPGHAVINELWLDERLIASEVAMNIGETHYSVKIAYNEEYAHQSPGTLLTARVMSDFAIPRGLKEFNCLAESPWFRQVWRSESRATVKCLLFADSPGGAFMRRLYGLYGRVRSFGTRQEGS